MMFELICWMIFAGAIGTLIGAGIGHTQGYSKGFKEGRMFQKNLTSSRYGLDKKINER